MHSPNQLPVPVSAVQQDVTANIAPINTSSLTMDEDITLHHIDPNEWLSDMVEVEPVHVEQPPSECYSAYSKWLSGQLAKR